MRAKRDLRGPLESIRAPDRGWAFQRSQPRQRYDYKSGLMTPGQGFFLSLLVPNTTDVLLAVCAAAQGSAARASPWVSSHVPPDEKKVPRIHPLPTWVDVDREGWGYSHPHLAVSWCPYSLLRQVLHLQVVHLQLSPQMQTPPRREGRGWLHMRLLTLGSGGTRG